MSERPLRPGVADYRERLELAARTAAPIFALFGWKWGTEPRATVPDEEAIADELFALMGDVLEQQSSAMSCGRLLITRNQDGTIMVSLELTPVFGGGTL